MVVPASELQSGTGSVPGQRAEGGGQTQREGGTRGSAETMSRHRKKNGVPDRWLDYQPVGKRLEGTRFIAFKVPLNQSLNQRLPPSEVFGPWELLDMMDAQNQELGLIIDLTFTKRYYKQQDVPESLLWLKIFTAGHEVPSDDTILSFKRAVRKFLRENGNNDKLIGVHCTHGLNRTGYLICRYLIDVDGMDPYQAVELFNSSRGHSIERQNYLDDLQTGPKRSNESMEECEQEPMRGCAARRPPPPRPDGEGGAQRGGDAWTHRSFPGRRTEPRPHHHYRPHPEPRPHHHNRSHMEPRPHHHNHPHMEPHPHMHEHPHDGLLPTPPPQFYLPAGGVLHHPYRWTPPPPPSNHWRRAPPPLPRYAAPWSDEPSGRGDAAGGAWLSASGRPQHGHTRQW